MLIEEESNMANEKCNGNVEHSFGMKMQMKL